VNGNMISKQDIIRLTKKIRDADDAAEFPAYINFFDRWTLLALCYFIDQKVDAIVLETGLGGRYDTTNILPDDAVRGVLLTSISLDHQELLGDTVEQIAWQKAGIIKPSATAVTAKSQAEGVKQVFRQEALKRGVDTSSASKYAEVEAPEALLAIMRSTRNSQLNIDHAAYQADNAALVWHTIQLVCPHLQSEQESLFRAAVDSVAWPCRFETFNNIMINDCTVIIDGAHNEDSVQKFYFGLSQFTSHIIAAASKKIELWSLFGCGETRNWVEMVRIAEKNSDRLILCKSKHYRAMHPDKLVSAVVTPSSSKILVWTSSVREALIELLHQAQTRSAEGGDSDHTMIVIAVSGSLFIAAEARATLRHEGLAKFNADDSVHEEDEELPSNYK
jgi:dihydrofolate synthase / folylpolyglutamate synthase